MQEVNLTENETITISEYESDDQFDYESEAESSERFDFHFVQLQLNILENTQYEFEYDFPNKTNSYNLFEGLRSFMETWVTEINSLKLNAKESTKIYQLVTSLVDKLTATNVELFRDPNSDMTAEHIANMSSDLIKSEISLYETSYKFNKTIRSGLSYIHPEERAIGTRVELKRDRNSNTAIPRTLQSTCQYVPITQSLISLFKNDEFRRLYFTYNSEKHTCVEGRYQHFCCGDVFKKSSLFMSDQFALQIQIFADDFEPCNPLQSKAGVHKLSAVYFVVKNFPMQYQSKLDYIQLVCLCHSDDINKSTQADFNNIWHLIIEDMSKLETEGISVGSKKIKGAICYPSFDNLGANIALGFAGSFSAHYFCRFCECNSFECSTSIDELESKIRTEENYASRIKTIESLDKIDYRRTCGVKRDCLLNELKHFHVTKNISADILHDIYEGAMPFVLNLIIDFMIASKIGKKDEIIQMVQFFDFGELNGRNIPSVINLSRSNLGQNGAQVKCLFLHFPFIIAKFRNNEQLKNVWNCMESLALVSQIIHSFDLSTNNLNELNAAVSTLLNSLQVNFGVKLIPKLHNLVHYVRIIKSIGPIAHMNVQRFESKHKVFKQIISRSSNYTNICKTLAIRHQQHISMSDFGLKEKVSGGVKRLLTIENCGEDEDLINIYINNQSVYETKYFCFNHFKYKENKFIITADTLYEVNKIFIINDEFHFYCSTYELIEFDSFYNAYEINLKLPKQRTLFKCDNLELQNIFERKVVEGKEFIIAETLDVRKCLK